MARDRRKPAKTERKTKRAVKPTLATAASFPVVGIGASAGGLEAFTKLLHKLPPDTGMALVLILHLDPKHESILASLISRSTHMPVHEVTHQMPVEPNHVYVIPRNTNMRIVDSKLLLTRRLDIPQQHMPVDHFLQSLAEAQKSKAIGIVLSGTATDGTAGLRAIKSEGGVTFAQSLSSARFDGMPRSAIAAGAVDFVLTPEEIALELANISRHPYVAADTSGKLVEFLETGEGEFNQIFRILRAHTGSDFSAYKRGTIGRRVRRRMVLLKQEKLADYVKILQASPSEVNALYEDLLIHVTEFFRDAKTFAALKDEVFPKLLKGRPKAAPIRIWVPGCSTGEEVYSIATLLTDFLADHHAETTVQIFGTDVSETAIGKARIGFYPESMVAHVPADIFQRYFNKTEHGFRISKRIRDICVFARQDLTRDPPFSKVDLISCRNVLIYLGQDLQKKVLPIFHYALKADGYLVLGSSESLPSPHLFSLVDKNCKIYRKKPTSDRPALDFSLHYTGAEKPVTGVREESQTELDLQREVDRTLLARYGPAGVVINDQLEIVQFRGEMSPYLQPVSGAASLNFLRMVRKDLLPELRTAVDLARRGTAPVRVPGLRLETGELRPRELNVEIIPIGAAPNHGRLFLVLFENVSRSSAAVASKTGLKATAGAGVPDAARLRKELDAAREHLQYLMDERQSTEEELRSANEEILSSNEELQSTNEELETSQEELQSANEELTTVNDELQHRNTELAQLSNDLNNLLTSVNIPIVMLGNDLNVRHFTPMAGRVLNLRTTDMGRPILEIKSNLEIPDLEKLLSEVVHELKTKEMDVQDRSGAWYSMRIRPYRTEGNKIDGAVIVLYDVDQIKRSLQELRRARDFSEAIVETVPEPLVILDPDLRVMIANRAFFDTVHLHRQNTEGKPLHQLGRGEWDIPALRKCLGLALTDNRTFTDLEIEGDFQRIGRKKFMVGGRRIDLGDDKRKIILLTLTDVTAQRLAEQELRTAHQALEQNLQAAKSSLLESEADLRQSREELRALAARLLTTQEEERRRVSRELHDDLNQKLAMLEVEADRLAQQAPPTPELAEGLESLRSRVAEVSNDVRRVAYQLHPSILDHLGLSVAVRSYCAEFSKREGIRVKFSTRDQPDSIPEEIALCLYRVTQEGLRNIAKHASAKSASVALETVNRRLHLCIRDNGKGFDTTLKRKGGIGLLSMKERVRLVDGEFTLRSNRGKGAKIDVWVPLPEGSK